MNARNVSGKSRTAKKANASKIPAVIAFKGFNPDLTCRGFSYAIGETYKHDGNVEACSSGFHACEHPLDVFNYYPPSSSRFCQVELGGKLDRHGSDTKIAAAEITIKAELKLPELIAAAVKYVFDRAKWIDGPVATENNEAATASGTRGAATASGYQGAATASGWRGKARGSDGCAIFLVERDDEDIIMNVWAGIAGRDGIKADTFYRLVDGKPVEEEA